MSFPKLFIVMGIIKNLFYKFQDQREVLDLTSFGDELAFKTSWNPLAPGGTNFCTHELQKSTSPLSGDLLIFKTTALAILFSASFILMGLAVFIPGISSGEDAERIIGLVFVGGGCWISWGMKRQESVFDRSSRRLAKGDKTYDLEQVCAIQLIREYVSAKETRYYSYELNLVCIDGERVNIIDHGSLRAIRKDAETLADYLSIPVWDAIDFKIPEQAAHRDVKSEISELP